MTYFCRAKGGKSGRQSREVGEAGRSRVGTKGGRWRKALWGLPKPGLYFPPESWYDSDVVYATEGGADAMMTQRELEMSPLFQDIRYEDYRRMMGCFKTVQKSFRPDDVAWDLSAAGSGELGVIERGRAALIRMDEDGVTTVLEDLESGGVFGLPIAEPGGDSLEVVCRTACDVLFIDYSHILKRCERACVHHSLLVRNMLELMSGKALALAERVDVLSRRSIREKLLCYFRQLAKKAGGDTFTLPFSLSTLADYIAADRSAMMRELKRLREEGILRSEGRQFTLC